MRKKKRQRNRAVVVRGDGDPCPRCGVPMQIREYSNLTDKDLHQPYFYTRWFCCMNKSCRTTLVMPERLQGHEPSDVRRCSNLIIVAGQRRRHLPTKKGQKGSAASSDVTPVVV
jgi:hypothetical protein